MNDEYGLAHYPWEKQDGETAASYAAFVIYRDQGYRRTLRQTAIVFYEIPKDSYDPKGEHAGKIRNVERWSALHRWVDRAERYDAWVQTAKDADDLEALRDMRVRHAQLAGAIQGKLVGALNELSPRQIAKMSLDQIARALQTAASVERQARGVGDLVQVGSRTTDEQSVGMVSDEGLVRKLEAFKRLRDEGLIDDEGNPVTQEIPADEAEDDGKER